MVSLNVFVGAQPKNKTTIKKLAIFWPIFGWCGFGCVRVRRIVVSRVFFSLVARIFSANVAV